MKAVCIKVCSSLEAERDRHILENNGIRVAVVAHDEAVATTIGGGMGQVEILVNEVDEPAARSILQIPAAGQETRSLAELSQLVIGELRHGKGQEAIAQYFVARGWSEARARQFVAEKARQMQVQPINEQKASENASVYVNKMLRGLFWMTAGFALTFITYSFSRDSGGYFIWWGAVLWGAVDFIGGLMGWLKRR